MRWAALLFALMLSAVLAVDLAHAQGILEAFSLNEEAAYSLLSTKTTDASGTTTKTVVQTAIGRSTYRLNYNLLPTLNLNAGVVAEKTYSFLTGDVPDIDTELTRLTPYVWLTVRDPVYDLAVGWDRNRQSVKDLGSGQSTSLTRDTYTANLNWRPVELPYTQVRYTRTSTRDDPRVSIDTDQDQVYLKTQYAYRGLDASYTGNYIDTRDAINSGELRQIEHEGRLTYAATFLDNRVSVVSDNRIRHAEITTTNALPAGVENSVAFNVTATQGLSSLDDTPLDEPLTVNPALIDGDLATSAGLNLGFPGPGGDFRRRNVGLDFGTAQAVNRLLVWADGFGPDPLPTDISDAFSWEIYTSTDNLNWALHATVPVAPFGPFDRRFVLTFPPVTTRFIKAVTRPLSGGVVGSTNSSLFTTVFITELQAFSDAGAGAGAKSVRVTQTNRTHSFDLKVTLFRSPSLYYRLTGNYQEVDPGSLTRYVVSNGLFFNHQLTPIFSTSANASFEFGKELDLTRQAVLYYASLGATPFRTLSDSLVFSGNRQWEGSTADSTDSVVLYNTAQVYRGIDAIVNLGAVFTSHDEGGGNSSQRRDLYVNLGTTITPHPSLTMSTYYLGKMTHASGANVAPPADRTENRLDLNVSFNPFATLFLTAAINIDSTTGQRTNVLQNYGLNWAPFPDGSLQASFFYAETQLTEGQTTRIIQPTVRWYLTPRRRSYVEATYQFNTAEGSGEKTESHLLAGKVSFYLW